MAPQDSTPSPIKIRGWNINISCGMWGVNCQYIPLPKFNGTVRVKFRPTVKEITQPLQNDQFFSNENLCRPRNTTSRPELVKFWVSMEPGDQMLMTWPLVHWVSMYIFASRIQNLKKWYFLGSFCGTKMAPEAPKWLQMTPNRCYPSCLGPWKWEKVSMQQKLDSSDHFRQWKDPKSDFHWGPI